MKDYGAKNRASLQNQCKHSQLETLINLITGKMAYTGKNYGSVAKNLAILQNQ